MWAPAVLSSGNIHSKTSLLISGAGNAQWHETSSVSSLAESLHHCLYLSQISPSSPGRSDCL
jgi:hypothetical protein